MIYVENEQDGLNEEQIRNALENAFSGRRLKKVLIVPPDFTRLNSGAGMITEILCQLLKDTEINILPALGTHEPMTRDEQIAFFGENTPEDCFLVHDWRKGIKKIGQIPASFVRDISDGLMNEAIDVEVSGYLPDPSYDLILSVGQVVPHEVAGMANYTKNIVIGCGGSRFINSSHMLGAYYGIERILGKDYTPVRLIFDYAQEHFISKLGVEYILTVTVTEKENTRILGMYIDSGREGFNRAVRLSQKHNITHVEKPINTCVVRLDESEYRSTWLGNKAVYRTRPAMADGGDLIILAPGVMRFGEDAEADRLIRKYGYCGRERILEMSKSRPDLRENLSAAAHLIHGSTDGRFTVTYATEYLTKEDIEGVGYQYLPYSKAVIQYNPAKFNEGLNITAGGECVYYIDNPALGLWTV